MTEKPATTGPEIVAEIASEAVSGIDEYLRRDPKTLTREDKLELIKRERAARAQFIKDDDAKRARKASGETEEE